jgi:hypothetical protein
VPRRRESIDRLERWIFHPCNCPAPCRSLKRQAGCGSSGCSVTDTALLHSGSAAQEAKVKSKGVLLTWIASPHQSVGQGLEQTSATASSTTAHRAIPTTMPTALVSSKQVLIATPSKKLRMATQRST